MHTTLIDSLRSPACYPHPVDSVELVETHISWVLLAGDYVYKLKKPLDLGFLDFSSLEKRRFFCEEEIRLNRRTAPDLYLEVVPIRGTPENPSLTGSDPVLDYAVRMRRFDTAAGFDRLLAQHRLTRDNVLDLGRRLAELHAIAAVAGPDSQHGSFDTVAGPARDNFSDLARTLQGETIAANLAPVQAWTERQLSQLAPMLEARRRNGFVRECHADAHLGNVALIDGQATLFDCVEFSSDLRWIDIMCDVAFTVMDLHSRGESGFAWLLLDEYLAATGDYEGLRLLPLYLVYRALIRAKVTALRLGDADADREALLAEAAIYLELAERISREHRPSILITTGVSGSGKSWLARELVERVGLVRLRSDVERKRLHGLTQGSQSQSGMGSHLYSQEATRHTYRYLADMVRFPVDAGMPALVDAACLKHWQRRQFGDLAAELRLPFGILYCQADTAVLHRRLRNREAAGNDVSEAGLAVLEHQQQTLEPLDERERLQTLCVDTAGDSIDRAADWVRQLTLDGISHITAT